MKKPTVEERRNEILEVTCEVVIERGFAATRIADVAKRLDVSSSLIHYHFDSKEQLLAEAFSHYARKELADLMEEVESLPTAVAQLDRAVQNSVPEGSGDMEWMLWIDAWGEALRNPMMKRISQELDAQAAAHLREILEWGVESGEFVCPDPQAAAVRLTAVIDGLAVQFAAHDGMLSREQLLDHVRTLAAWEVGLEPDSLRESGTLRREVAHLAPATDIALRQLISKYCDAVVRRDTEAFTALWTLDATWHLGTKSFDYAALGATFDKLMKGYKWLVQTAPNAVFEVDEAAGTGTGRVAIVEQYEKPRTGAGTLVGVYHDRYVRKHGVWLFAERTLEIIHHSN